MSLGKKLFIGSSAAGACSADSVNPFDDGLTSSKALYQFDGNANDTAGSYNATASSGVTYTSGYIGQAATMGGNDSINTNDGGALLGDTWSISFFVKFDNANDYEYIAANWRSNPTPRITNWYLLKRNSSNSNVLEFNVYGSNGTNSNYKQFIAPSSSAFTSNTWYHIAISFNGSSATDVGMYINGLPVSYTTNTGSGWDGSAQISTTLDTTIGALSNSSGGSNYLDGQIDQVRFFNKAISDAEAVILGNETTDTASDVNVLNDGSGAALYSLDHDASDASGNYDGTATNVTFGVDGQINTGASFNGSSSKITIPSSATAPVNISTGTFSISMWVNMDNLTNNNKLVYKWGSTAANRNFLFTVLNSSGYLYFIEGTTGGDVLRTGTFALSTNTWHHITLTRQQSGSLKMYVDGDLKDTFAATGTFKTSTEPIYLGYQLGQSTNFTGSMDQVRMFTKELSSTEVSTLYAETACVYTSTTDNNDYPVTNAAYYKLDNNAEDAKGSYNGAESNITYEFGRFGQAAVFNGSSSDIEINKSVFGTGDGTADVFTISLWFNSTNKNAILAGTRGNSSSQGFIIWFRSDGTITYDEANATGNIGSITTTSTYDDGNWHNVVATRNASNQATLYVDGSVQVATTTISSPLTSHTNNLFIGKYTGGSYYYNGLLDQVRIFNSALDATAVENLYNEKPEVNTSNFETVLYNGTSSDRYVSNVGFQPDLVWIKRRNSTNAAVIQDSVRGENNYLMPSSANAQASNASFDSFEGNGFELTGGGGSWNNSAGTYVAWCWKGGGNAVNNTDGNITSQVSANQDAGFSIVKYTGSGSAMTIGHGLSSAPELIIFKSTNTTQDWLIATTVIDGSLDYFWDATAGFGAATKSDLPWSVPDSSVINFGSSSDVINNLSGTQQMIAYCFHSVAGYQKVGSYTGGGSSGKTVTTGFRPSWVMIKRTDVSNYWVIIDSKRDTTDPYSKILWANVSDIEADGGTATAISFSDTGFSMSTSAVGSSINASGGTYIYLAIA